MYLEQMSSKQLQSWIARLCAAINDGNNTALYQKWLAEAQAEQLKRIKGFAVVSCAEKK